jgi:hypothetical protein
MGDCAGERLGIGTNKTDARHLLTARRPAIASPRRPVQVGHFGRCWDVDRSRPGAVRVVRRRVVAVRPATCDIPSDQWSTVGALPTPPERTMSQSPQTSAQLRGYGFVVKLSSCARNMCVENTEAIGFVHCAVEAGCPGSMIGKW